METSQQKFELRTREGRWCAAAEIDGFRRAHETGALLIEFAQYCFTKSRRLRAIEQILVKCAIRADSRAKGNVNVDVVDHKPLLSFRAKSRNPAPKSVDRSSESFGFAQDDG